MDSFTAPDGTVYEARASHMGNGVVKVTTNEDGTKTVESLLFNKTKGIDKKKSTSTKINKNISKVNQEFAGFKQAAEAAASTTEAIGYTDANITSGGGGFLQRDKASSVNLTDASGNSIATISSTQGKTSEEISRVRTLADEIININKSAITIIDDDDDITDGTDGTDDTTGTGTTGLTAGDYMQTVNPAVAGGDLHL